MAQVFMHVASQVCQTSDGNKCSQSTAHYTQVLGRGKDRLERLTLGSSVMSGGAGRGWRSVIVGWFKADWRCLSAWLWGQ